MLVAAAAGSLAVSQRGSEAFVHQDLIYDVGMNNGDDTAYYLRRGFRVIAIEANTRLAKCAAERFRTQISSGQLRILNIGIAAEEGELPFWICETYSEWSSFDRKIASRDGCPHHEVMVPCRRFASVLEEFGVPYYLKVDIEGNDILCLQDLNPQRLPKFVSMESASPGLITLMAGRGFKRFKAISQYNFLPIELPPSPEQRRYERVQWMLQTRNPLVRGFRLFGGRGWLNRQLNRSRRHADWTFPFGCSGPFGEDLPGRWLDRDELITTLKYLLDLKEQKRTSPFWDDEQEYSFWVDVHGRVD
jgi:FkbM family methyltransferase